MPFAPSTTSITWSFTSATSSAGAASVSCASRSTRRFSWWRLLPVREAASTQQVALSASVLSEPTSFCCTGHSIQGSAAAGLVGRCQRAARCRPGSLSAAPGRARAAGRSLRPRPSAAGPPVSASSLAEVDLRKRDADHHDRRSRRGERRPAARAVGAEEREEAAGALPGAAAGSAGARALAAGEARGGPGVELFLEAGLGLRPFGAEVGDECLDALHALRDRFAPQGGVQDLELALDLGRDISLVAHVAPQVIEPHRRPSSASRSFCGHAWPPLARRPRSRLRSRRSRGRQRT